MRLNNKKPRLLFLDRPHPLVPWILVAGLVVVLVLLPAVLECAP